MNESMSELLTKVTLYDLIWSLLLIATMVGILISQKKKISKWMNKWREDKNEEDELYDLVYKLRDSVESIKKAKDDIYDTMNKQSQDIENLTHIVIEMEKKNSKTKRAEIKEKIERIYSECHPALTCTDMQFETLKELIEEYEEHGGTNSFVHSTVEPEMYKWNKIKKIRDKEV